MSNKCHNNQLNDSLDTDYCHVQYKQICILSNSSGLMPILEPKPVTIISDSGKKFLSRVILGSSLQLEGTRLHEKISMIKIWGHIPSHFLPCFVTHANKHLLNFML